MKIGEVRAMLPVGWGIEGSFTHTAERWRAIGPEGRKGRWRHSRFAAIADAIEGDRALRERAS